MTVNPEVVREISALWSRRAARVLVNTASAVPVPLQQLTGGGVGRGDSTILNGRTLLILFGSKLPAPSPVTVWIDPGTMAPWVFTGGAGVHLVTEMPSRPGTAKVTQ